MSGQHALPISPPLSLSSSSSIHLKLLCLALFILSLSLLSPDLFPPLLACPRACSLSAPATCAPFGTSAHTATYVHTNNYFTHFMHKVCNSSQRPTMLGHVRCAYMSVHAQFSPRPSLRTFFRPSLRPFHPSSLSRSLPLSPTLLLSASCVSVCVYAQTRPALHRVAGRISGTKVLQNLKLVVLKYYKPCK